MESISVSIVDLHIAIGAFLGVIAVVWIGQRIIMTAIRS